MWSLSCTVTKPISSVNHLMQHPFLSLSLHFQAYIRIYGICDPEASHNINLQSPIIFLSSASLCFAKNFLLPLPFSVMSLKFFPTVRDPVRGGPWVNLPLRCLNSVLTDRWSQYDAHLFICSSLYFVQFTSKYSSSD